MVRVCGITVIENNRFNDAGLVAWCDKTDQFMFRSTLVAGLEYETIDKVPDRVLAGISARPYTGQEFSITPYSLDRVMALKAAAVEELTRRRYFSVDEK